MTKEKKFITCDGNYAASYISYMFSEVACIYPITPSSTMAEVVDEWAANGRKNIWGQKMRITEMQSEGGAAGAVHGSLQSGTLTTTYTASQGLLLMIPNMYKIAGELLPSVFHVSARALAGHALSIFGDHSDVYACRQTGFAMLASGSVQETMDLSGVAHLATLKTRIPFLNFFDGFRTSHEIQKIQPMDQEKIAALIDQDALQAFRDRALNPEHPFTRGTAQNPDIFFQAKEACNPFYDAVPDVVEAYMQEITKITGREYHPFTYYGDKDAENVIVAMGSVTETIREVIDYLNAQGKKYGLVSVHLYRPFAIKYFMNVMPSTVKKITVLDRTKEPGANGDPLYLDVRDAFYGKENCPIIVGGRYGLGSKDVTPSQIIAVYKNLEMKEPKGKFTIGIVDDVTFTSLPLLPEIKVSADDIYEAKFYGLGSDGTVGANKNSIKIIGSATDKYCQAYFAYDSKKSGGFTASHLRFGDSPIRSTYLITTPDFVACHVQAYINLYDVLKGLKKGGSFLLNTIWEEEEVKHRLPNNMKKYLAENEIKFYTINGTKLAVDLGLGNRTNTIMQSAFFRITNVIPYELAVEQMKKAIVKSYGMKGEQIVNMNFAAVDAGGDNVTKIEVPSEWANLTVEAEEVSDRPDFIRRAVDVINAQKGDDLPVSIFKGIEDGTFPAGTTQYEKRGIAVDVPEWIDDNCIQCNQCSYVCPHAAIRPFLISEEEMAKLPEGTTGVKANGKQYAGLTFRIQVAPYDCTGCGNCADVCPSKEKALIMKPLESQLEKGQGPRWDAIDKYVTYKDKLADKDKNIKNSQFAQPLFEFSGACAGCGETPYIKLITQLFGERMMVANATGCSSIYGGSAPATSYTYNKESGHGPAWANSLFEDNAEYGFGMNEGVTFNRDRISSIMTSALEAGVSAEEAEAFNEWIENRENAAGSEAATAKVLAALTGKTEKYAMELVSLKQYMIKKSVWIFGGDGWAYDIGYGGLDHVMASGQNVNILVMDTEVYSNTGGQSSKATPIGAVAKFAAAGKRIRKKDLGVIAMSYGYVYVAQVAMGANQAQYLKTIREAEAYPGPSLIIAYSPCIAHGLRSMGRTQEEEKLAVECGYWHLYRYNPQMEDEGKNPFQLDSKEPDWSKFQEYLNGEVRYTALKKSFPKEADELFQAAQENALWRYRSYQRMSNSNWAIAAPAAE